MRQFLVAFCVLLFAAGCADKKVEQPAAKKEPPAESQPVDIGDPNAPTMIRALQGAKEVKGRIDAQRKEDSKVLEQQ